MKHIFTASLLIMLAVATSCSVFDFGSSVNDLVDTEWSYTDDEGTIGIKIYANNIVTSFVDNKYGVETINGTYEYIVSSKTLSFKGLDWYYSSTMQLAFSINGAHILNGNKMEVIIKEANGNVGTDYFYRR